MFIKELNFYGRTGSIVAHVFWSTAIHRGAWQGTPLEWASENKLAADQRPSLQPTLENIFI
jgi:hypothetical protein